MTQLSGKIGIFGGSFNPPHVAHVMACQFALCAWELDQILVIPSYVHPLDKELAPYEHRIRMCEQAFAYLKQWVTVSRLEEELGGISYTIDTLRELHRREPEAEMHLIIGSDILDETNRWKEFAEVERLAPPLVVPRLETGISTEGGKGFYLPEVSSTEIRAALRAGEGQTSALPAAVMRYIQQNQLYGYGSTGI